MRALRKTGRKPGLELVDIPEPRVSSGQVKIRVLRAGLCGTDLHLDSWDDFAADMLTPPLTIGHEFYGEIVDIGPNVPVGHQRDELAVGMRVSVEGHVVCGRCRNCRAGRRHMCIRTSGIGVNQDGAFADYVVVPASNVWVQPPAIDADLGAIFDPLGNAFHTALQTPMVGEDVLITGAGPIGVMAAAIARHSGARNVVVTDISPYRLNLAAAAGANRVVNVAEENLADILPSLNMREGFDVAMEMSGQAAAMNDILSTSTHGAHIALLGLPSDDYPIDWGKVITHMFTIKGVYGREMFDTWYHMTFCMESSPDFREAIRAVITHRFDATEWQAAFDAARSGQCGKVIMDWS
ncbi:MAG: L-threonine 3-dehydrogenase [Bowdeniella nasicola]|nr:L-threonine 3-dehydrogenase [Bowdeniella nasicola]